MTKDKQYVHELAKKLGKDRDKIVIWNPNTKVLDEIHSISINGNAVQLNIGEYEKEE